jgi:hypothetical protein
MSDFEGPKVEKHLSGANFNYPAAPMESQYAPRDVQEELARYLAVAHQDALAGLTRWLKLKNPSLDVSTIQYTLPSLLPNTIIKRQDIYSGPSYLRTHYIYSDVATATAPGMATESLNINLLATRYEPPTPTH